MQYVTIQCEATKAREKDDVSLLRASRGSNKEAQRRLHIEGPVVQVPCKSIRFSPGPSVQ